LSNFEGSYQEVFSRFVPLLAVTYNAQVAGKIKLKGRGNKELARVIRKAKDVGVRYVNENLAPTDPLPEWARKGKRAAENQLKYMISGQERGKQKVPQVVQEYLENMQSKGNVADLSSGKQEQ
jgi:hypothetical protein